MKIFKYNKNNYKNIIKQTIKTLENGGLVVFPSDTVYGLLCDATNPKAVDKLLTFKERPTGKAISVFVCDKKMAEKYVQINQNALNIISNLLPGPFTVICKNQPRKASPFEAEKIDIRLPAENGTLGFRIPDYPLIIGLVKQFGRPLTATSANISSTSPHYSIKSLLKSIGQRPAGASRCAPTKKISLIDLIVDAGNLPKNKPSTVVDTTSGELKTLRFGDLLPATSNSLISKSEKQTMNLARFILTKALQKQSGKPIVFLLNGNLGTGKTVFTKGLGKALGIKENIVSPTFTLCYEYSIPQCGISTENLHLSTNSPIENSSQSDIERLNQNIKLVEQESKNGIMNNELCIKGKVKIKNTHYPKFIIHPPLLVHYDLYRIESSEDLKEIQFLESIKPGNIYSIEWPERINESTISKLKEISQIVYIDIRHVDEKTREFKWSN